MLTMGRTVAQKMGIDAGARSYLMHAPADVIAVMDLPRLAMSPTLDGEFAYLHVFVTSQAMLAEKFPQLKSHLSAEGKLWVSWPKGRKLGTDLTLPVIIRIGYSFGLVESTTLSINSTWSAIKFTHPIPGKIYHNSYGTLPTQ